MLHPVVAHAVGQGGDIAGVVVVVLYRSQFRHVAALPQGLQYRVQRGGGAARGVLRVERQGENAVAALFLERGNGIRHGWVAVAHGEFDH
jgi:hypothetical protein